MVSIDLTVFTFLHNVSSMLGWVVNNALWATLNGTMLAAIPFLAVVVREWYQARREGEDEGNKGLLSLNRIEASLYAMVLVYMFAAFPLMNVQFAPANIDEAHYDSCSTHVVTGADSAPGGTALGGKTAEVPIWWAFVHSVSMGLTNAMIAALPCQPNYQYIRTTLHTTQIQDPKLSREVSNFQTACYGASRAKLFREHGAIDDKIAKDTDWIGSRYFLNTPGYYDSMRSNGPVKGFAYQEKRDSGRGTTPDQGGYPNCKQWWSAKGHGLEARLHDELKPTFWEKFKGLGSHFGGPDAQDYAIRGLLANHTGVAGGNVGATRGGAGSQNGFSGVWNSGAGAAGAALASVPAAVMKDALARAIPMIQKFALMAIIIGMPLVVVASGYSVTAVGTLTFAYFGTISLTFWFELSRWLQNHLIDMVYHSTAAKLGMFSGVTSTYDQLILGLVESCFLIIFPGLWFMLISWAGFKAGSAISGALAAGSGEAKSAGKQGGSAAQSAATKSAKKL